MSPTPRVATVQDLSGLGRCSLTVILPVLSVMGAQCCPLPTAVLSAHTGFPHAEMAAFCDLTDTMHQTIAHWATLGTTFDAIYSGFLGSAPQMDALTQLIHHHSAHHPFVLVDPVMGDHGKVYRTYTPEMCRKMEELSNLADLITPNITEAALLLHEDFANAPTTPSGIAQWLRRLSNGGSRSVVLTGVSLTQGQVGAGCYDHATGQLSFAMADEEPGQFSGTGDLFAAVLLGAVLRGETLPIATTRAVHFVQAVIAHTIAQGTPPLDGVAFEGLLGQLVKNEK